MKTETVEMRVDPRENSAGKTLVVLSIPALSTLVPTAMVPALPRMAEHFARGGDGALFAQMVMTVPAIVMILAAPLAGMLAEVIGRRSTLLTSLVLFVLSGTFGLVSPNAETLIVSRLLVGLACGGMLTTGLSLVGDYPSGARERVLGFFVAASAVSALLSMTLGGYIVDAVGWRGPFALYLFGIPVLVIVWFRLKPHRHTAHGHHNLLTPVRQFWNIYLLAIALTVGMFMPAIQGPFMLQAGGITSAAMQGALISACALIAAFSSSSFGWLSGWLGARGLVALIAGSFGAGCTVAALFSGMVPAVIGFGLVGVGAGLVEATAATMIMERAPESLRPRALGILLSAIFLGQFINPIVVDPLRAIFGIRGSFLAVGVGFFLLAISAIFATTFASRGEAVIQRPKG